jgi:cysteine desulfurase
VLLRGGRQEQNRRAGTENLPAIAGFGVACELAHEHQ